MADSPSSDVLSSTPDAARERSLLRVSRFVCAALAVGGAALRLGVALRPIDLLDRLFISDDTYSTLNIARALAYGLGSRPMGSHLTNGFQPLLALMMVPVFWFTRDPDTALRASLVLLAVIDSAVAFALGELARKVARIARHGAALIATAAWVASPLAISYAMSGTETSLLLLFSTWMVLAWCAARTEGTPRAYFITGLLAGASILARIDCVILVLGLGLWELARLERRLSTALAAGCGAIVGPWWVYELIRFQSLVPESGSALRERVNLYKLDERWNAHRPSPAGHGSGHGPGGDHGPTV